MFNKIKEWIKSKKAAVVAKMTDDKGEMYVPTLVMVGGAVMLGFVLISIFAGLFQGVIKEGLTEAFTSIFTNIKTIIGSGSPTIS